MDIQPYLYFEGRAEEAAEFYRQALDAQVASMMRYGESPEPPPWLPAGCEQKVMHFSLKLGDQLIMGSDGMCGGTPGFKGFALTITAPDEATCRRYFDALGLGGQVQMPLARTFFAPLFGMVTDRFGLQWMLMLGAAA